MASQTILAGMKFSITGTQDSRVCTAAKPPIVSKILKVKSVYRIGHFTVERPMILSGNLPSQIQYRYLSF